jgi:hypothetical protein
MPGSKKAQPFTGTALGKNNLNQPFFPALIAAQRFFCAALIAALPASDILCFLFAGTKPELPRIDSSSRVSLVILSWSLAARRS